MMVYQCSVMKKLENFYDIKEKGISEKHGTTFSTRLEIPTDWDMV